LALSSARCIKTSDYVVTKHAGRRPAREEGKAFFFEKKKQKTFVHLASAGPDELGLVRESFLVLLFKKERAFFGRVRLHVTCRGEKAARDLPAVFKEGGCRRVETRLAVGDLA
jgi:hypothetical protein